VVEQTKLEVQPPEELPEQETMVEEVKPEVVAEIEGDELMAITSLAAAFRRAERHK